MYTDLVMDHFTNPRNVGEIEDADGVGQIGNPVCGDVMRISIAVDDSDHIDDVKFKTFGCGAAVATSSMVTEMVMGKSLTEAADISNKAVAEALGGLPPEQDALLQPGRRRAAPRHPGLPGQERPRGRGRADPQGTPKRPRALVALSGGVDSAVAALRLIDEGRRLETATARLWPGTDRRSCCSPGSLQRAARTAAHLGLPHHVLDLEAEFEDAVVEPFERGYLGGETPNPCVDCNPMRLAALVALAGELGLARVATGHYARLVWRDGEPFVARAADRGKDQSYMLWAVPPEVLARLEFPLGELTKTQARQAAADAGLEVGGSSPRARRSASPSTATVRFLDGARRRAGRGRRRRCGGSRASAGTTVTGASRSASAAASA